MHHEKSPGSSCALGDFLGAYESFCRKNSRALIPVNDLIKIVQAVFGDDSYVHGPTPMLRGFRPKSNLVSTPQNRMGPPPPRVTPSPVTPMAITPATVKVEEAGKSDQVDNDDAGSNLDDGDEMEIDPAVSTDPKSNWNCFWHSDNGKPCDMDCGSREGLFNHIKEIHLNESIISYTCMWKGCRRIDNSSRRDQLIQHVGIHLLELSKSKVNGVAPQTPKSQTAQTPSSQTSHTSQGPPSSGTVFSRPGLPSMNNMGLPGQSAHIYPDINDELRGIPLTALLVLRNLARHPDNRRLYYPFEQTLAALVAQPRFSKLASSILAEL
jgi:hypothetical protein